MPLEDDGDIIRGMGYVAIYAGYLEEQVDNLLFMLNVVEAYPADEQRWGVSKKIKKAKRLIDGMNFQDRAPLLECLTSIGELFEWRNEIIHGRIYANADRPDELKSGRPNIPTRAIDSSELYELANKLHSARLELYRPMIFQIPRAMATAKNI
jgi:hypothetical protein